MATSKAFQQKTERVLSVVKTFIQQVPNQLYAYTIAEMGEDIGSGPFRDSERGSALSLRAPRNKTNKLRFQTNTLGRALEPNAEGNISKVDVKDGMLEVRYGIDTKVVKYAAIHEFGGTIKHPGGTPYKIVDGRAVFVSLRNAEPDLPRTKPHAIKIKKRPYLKPAYIEWQKQQIPRFLQRIAKAIES